MRREFEAAVTAKKASLAAVAAAILQIAIAGCGGSSNSTPMPTSTPDVVTFSPPSVALDNPADAVPAAAASSFSIDFTAHDASGSVIAPSNDNPLTVNLYGVPEGVITPSSVTLTSGTSATFQYNGGYLPKPVAVEAWMKNRSGGYALGVTEIVGKNRLACASLGTMSFQVPLQSTVPDVLKVLAAVGINYPQPADFQSYTIDTGSLGTVVPVGELNSADVIGPGPRGIVYYDSSGNTYSGRYYLARVTIQTSGGAVQTNPIEVLAIDKAYCSGPRTSECKKHPPKPDLHYLGVGFARGHSTSGDLFLYPAQNAFLELTDANGGTDISQGYVLSQGGITLGVTATMQSGFNLISLSPSETTPGDWSPIPGCYGFPQFANEPFCGNLLLDVGISEMFLDLPRSEIPSGANSKGFVPSGVHMTISAGDQANPAMAYEFDAVSRGEEPSGLAPSFVQWINRPSIFVNTGRRPLLNFNYMYNAQCGQAGFSPALQ
jgi:hypothetical protein